MTSTLDLAQQLRSISIFEGLDERQLGRVAAVARVQTVPVGQEIIHEGDSGESFFALLAGDIEITKRLGFTVEDQGGAGRRKTLVRLSAPQFFGEIGLLENAERSATVVAASVCRVAEITRADFEHLVAGDLDLGYRVVKNIARSMAARVHRTDRDVLKLTVALSLALGNR